MKLKTLQIIKDIFFDWRSYVAEFLATFVFLFTSVSVAVMQSLYGKIDDLGIALVVGFSYAAMIFLSAHLSGGFLNPAVTLALWLVKKLTGVKTIFLLLAQILASFAVAYTILLLFGETSGAVNPAVTELGLGVTQSLAVGIEAIFSAILVFVIFGTMVDRNGPVSFGPLAAGMFLTAATLILLPVTGAVLNPAKVLGPAIVLGSTQTVAVWIIGPLAGSLFALVYEVLFLRRGKKS